MTTSKFTIVLCCDCIDQVCVVTVPTNCLCYHCVCLRTSGRIECILLYQLLAEVWDLILFESKFVAP